MASTKIIGTAPDQVPTNGDLGDLAFQSKESVEFTGGSGGLSHLDLTAIAQSKAVSAVDVFVYDTSKDSDGGAWRKRTQHTSWYNEELNTAIRGSRREFPSVAVIVAESNRVTIHDGDDPNLPMWMVFSYTSGAGWLAYINVTYSGTSVSSVSALNGMLGIGVNNSSYGGFLFGNFASDSGGILYYGYNELSFNGGVAVRNTIYSGTLGVSTRQIVNRGVNDVAMTVLPNAPIYAATGLPIPTIAVATNGGVSVIKDDGSVVNITSNNSNYTYSRKVTFLPDNALGLSLEAGSPYQEDSFHVFNTIPSTSTVITVDTKSGNPISADAFYSAQFINTANVDLFLNGLNTNRVINKADRLNFGTPFGLTQLAENRSNPSAGMVAFIASKYNTGWMPGNARGAWLSDTTQETLVGAELVTNGTFDSNTNGWSANGSGYHTYSAISGALSVTRGSFGLGGGEPYQAISVTSGKFYRFSFVGASGDMSASVGSTVGGNQYLSWSSTGATTLREGTFQATSNTVYVLFICNNSGTTASVDNVSLRLADADRSVNNNGLQVFGNITKTPVATGADLVAYSGWTSSNYLKQPPNPALNFGSGSYSVMFWAKASGSGAGIAVGRGPNDGAESICVYLDTVSYGVYFDYGISNTYVYAPDLKTQVGDGKWHFVVCHVTAGQAGVVYWDGVKQTLINAVNGVAPATFINDPSWETYIGCGRQPEQPLPYHGSLALVRISAAVPSAEQIAKMYEDEKVLFQDNAKATLYGTSDAVTALAYDEDTNLLHVGTSSGRSVFNGLRRVDNTTDAVGACISAAGGMVAED